MGFSDSIRKRHLALPSPPVAIQRPFPYYRLAELDQRPLALTHPQLSYPESAEKNLSGKIIAQLLINADGNVDRVETLPTELPEIFVDAAKQTFINIKFKPGLLGGRPVASQLWLEIFYEDAQEAINPQGDTATPSAEEN